ncbi:MAG: Ltp family lipoprotein, partial [Ruminococcus sp.]
NFPADAAQYAIDNIKADWKENALEKAKTYYKDMSMSKSAVYDQLISEYGEQFTESEAQYAIDHLD